MNRDGMLAQSKLVLNTPRNILPRFGPRAGKIYTVKPKITFWLSKTYYSKQYILFAALYAIPLSHMCLSQANRPKTLSEASLQHTDV